MKKVLSIAGSDPSGGAGLQQDILVFSSLGAYPLSVASAVTSQNRQGVLDAHILGPDVVSSQLSSVFDDAVPDAVKTGMLGSMENVSVVCDYLKKQGVRNLVVDPVIWSSSGHILLGEDALPELKKLIGHCTLTTPNIAEAEILSGINIGSLEDRRKAAEIIGDCVITGGDADGVDLLYVDGKFNKLEGEMRAHSVHGTGCMFSSAIAVYLAYDTGVVEAVRKAKKFVEEKIDKSWEVAAGFRVPSPAADACEKGIVSELATAIQRFVSNKDAIKAAPEVGVNIVYALPGASAVNDVYGLSGRIVKAGGGLVSVGEVRRGGSSHMARVVLTVLKLDPSRRAAMNIRYSEDAVEACRSLGFSVSSFRRGDQPPDSPTMEWGTDDAIKSAGSVPDIIYDEGLVGKEPMIRVIGESPKEVVEKTEKILKGLD